MTPQLSASPPWHLVCLVALMTAVFVQSLVPAMQSIDDVATLETFGRRLFPSTVSLELLFRFRAGCSFLIFAVTLHMIVYGGWVHTTPYHPQSKLKRAEFKMYGIRTQAPFTLWSWNCLGISFGLNAWLTYQSLLLQQQTPSTTTNATATTSVDALLLRAAVILFEIVGPCALLVAFVVRYAMWPQVLQHGKGVDPTSILKTPRALLMHNANVIMVLTEVSLMGGLPVRSADFGVSALFGIVYILFTWSTMNRWAPEDGAQFLYHFFDTTLGMTTTLAILALLVTLMVFYGLFCVLHMVLEHLGGGIGMHSLAVVLVASLVCRFRD